jgi:hypothetical protein
VDSILKQNFNNIPITNIHNCEWIYLKLSKETNITIQLRTAYLAQNKYPNSNLKYKKAIPDFININSKVDCSNSLCSMLYVNYIFIY